jgi:CBS-domain-containing membrane protein
MEVRDALSSSLYAGLLLATTGLLAWLSGRPFVFPSLGPSAYLLATVGEGTRLSARRIVGGHIVGVFAGLLAYHTLAAGLVITGDATVLATEQLRLVSSGILAVVLTTAGMLTTETLHPPACATTLIVGLGLLSTPVEAGIIVLAVGVLFGTHTVARRVRFV